MPIIGTIRAGEPVQAVQNIEGYEVIERKYLTSGYEYFFLRVIGDSMDTVAPEGSLVLIRRQSDVDNGDIAVVIVNGHDATLKKVHRIGSCLTLSPMSTNPKHQLQIYDAKNTEIFIIGKAEKVLSSTDL